MHILKRLFVWLNHALLQLEVLGWITATTFVMLVGSAAPVKEALGKANLYDRVVDVVLQQSTAAGNQGTVPLDDATIKTLVEQVFSGQQIKQYSENFIDGTYTWLEGKSPEPTFKIDLTAARQTIATSVADKAAARLTSLPPCTKIPTGQLDPFSIDCLPPGLNVEREKQRILSEMLASKEFLPQTVITADQLPKDSSGKTFAQAHTEIPTYFKWLSILPWLLAAMTIPTIAVLIWLGNDKRRAIRSVGRTLIAVGGFILGTTLLFGFALPSLLASLGPKFISASAAPLLNEALTAILQSTNRAAAITSGSVTLLGAAILLAERFIKPSKQEQPAQTGQTAVPVEIEVNKNKEETENDRPSDQNKT